MLLNSTLANVSFGVYNFHFLLLIISLCSLYENILCEYLLMLTTKRAN